MRTPLLASIVIALAAPAAGQPAPRVLHVDVKDASGMSIAHAMVFEAPRGVQLYVEAYKLPAGFHGMHFHDKGACAGPDFTSAGDHVHRPGARVHGLMNPKGHEAGDLPNLFVGREGTAFVQVFSDDVSFSGKDGRPALTDADGSSLVIHAAADDYESQPAGGSGKRIACGVLATHMGGKAAGHAGH